MIFKDDCFLGKRFLLTGASGAIGGDIAFNLNKLGASVIAMGRNMESLQTLQEKMVYKDRFIPICKDFKELESLRDFAFNLSKEYGELNGAIFCAGYFQILPFRNVSLKDSLEVFNINYFANFEILKGLLDKRAKVKDGSSFIFISSNATLKAQKGLSYYSATKGAINTTIKSIALEIANKHRINAISPGIVRTEMTEALEKLEILQALESSYPNGIAKVSYITPLCLFLLSDDSFYITGENITIDGGASL